MKFSLTVVFSLIFFSSCTKYYNLGNGFRYGYFDAKENLNVYYEDQGIVHGVCYCVEWDAKFILIYSYLFDKGRIIDTETKYYLVDKMLYINDPSQTSSRGVIGPINKEEVEKLVILKKIQFNNKKTISYSR